MLALKRLYVLIFTATFALFIGVRCHEQHAAATDDSAEFHETHADEETHQLKHLFDRLDMDEEGIRHIKEHLSRIIKLPEGIDDIDDGQAMFYLFQLHDFDRNNKLDGLEWLALLTDFADTVPVSESGQTGGTMVLKEAEGLVDKLLTEHDLDQDGYIDFAEMSVVDKGPDTVWTRVGSVDPETL
ncbi:multiple coagulation factor deficiency protein 2 homolog isoform X2 [Branchiostoma floridae]|uniref:Multiple coagulation factor deficiency protein 2 homolog isoform X1 n=1 Tax=Branchiostoma floridae TaxID=7739 RepID=A0A9J7HL12_BRAFL|nr:multiple coagulation factor deficiency protein 2 homolog isoform X1 [Branchiostoma floridae]XP_035659895.1 multiple coagulation factor deficiency protein 2 homolog isoform X2 [Branchiostoma floridae]